jgi:hypothetical protein
VLKPLPVVDGQVATPITSAQYQRHDGEQAARAPAGRGTVRTDWWQTHAKANYR